MKILVDTENETIEVKEPISMDKLVEGLRKMFPDGEWKKYTMKLSTGTGITYYPPYYYYPNWITYPYTPFYTTCISEEGLDGKSGQLSVGLGNCTFTTDSTGSTTNITFDTQTREDEV